MSKAKKYIFIILVVLVIVGSIYYLISKEKGNKTVDASSTMGRAEVIVGDIEVSTSGASTIKSGLQKEIKSINNGKVEGVYVEEGQAVNEGDLLVVFGNDSTNSEIDRLQIQLQQELTTLSDYKESIENLNVYAPQSGYIEEINSKIGDKLSSGNTFASIIENDKVYISGYYNKSAVDNIRVGDKASITLQTYLLEVEGAVSSIKQTPESRTGGIILYEVVVVVDNPGAVTESETGIIVVHSSKGDYLAYEEASFYFPTPGDVQITTGGEISNLHVSNGMYVEKGQLLLILTNSDVQKQIDNQQYKVDSINSEISEKLQTLDDSSIYAPISGTITSIFVTEGEQVNSNTVLLEITDLNNLELIIPVDELDINKIELGQEAEITVGAVPGRIYSSVVSNIGIQGNSSNGVSTFDVILKINESESLKPGMTAEGKIVVEKKENTLLLPIEAIQTKRNESFVLLVGEGENASKETVSIKTGLVSENHVEITEGLSEGDIVEYQRNLTDQNVQTEERQQMMKIPGSNGGGAMPSGGSQGRFPTTGGNRQ